MSAEGIDPAVFERLAPSQFLSFSFPNPLSSPRNPYADTLRVAVADSPPPTSNPSPPAIAAVLVPHGREDDWVFSTAAGHFQLLLFLSSPEHPISRLVLIGDVPSSSSSLPRAYSRSQSDSDRTSLDCFQERLTPLLYALCPKAVFLNGMPSIPFVSYEDGVIRCNPVEKLVGPTAGEMLVEDVEIDLSPALPELRRRLRFKKMPNLIQTQVQSLNSFRRFVDRLFAWLRLRRFTGSPLLLAYSPRFAVRLFAWLRLRRFTGNRESEGLIVNRRLHLFAWLRLRCFTDYWRQDQNFR